MLLVLSHVWQWVVPPRGHPQPGQLSDEVHVYDENGNGTPVLMYYRDLKPAAKPDAPVLVLIHGSQVSAHGRDNLIQALAPNFRLIVPDLPGFGASVGVDLPDYSPTNYAAQITELLDDLKIPRAHLVAYGMGGFIALEVADAAPERVRSLVLIDSVGTTEFEWLGEARLNKAIYGAQLGLYNTARVVLPHFGLLETGPFNRAAVRIYWDAKQDHLRDMVKRWAGPLLLVHARDDFVATLQSAQENNRLSPQSTLITYPGGHWAGMNHPELIAPDITQFVQSAEQGLELTKPQASKARLAASLKPVVITGPSSRTYEALLLFILAVLTLFGEDLTCISAGLLVAQGVLGFWPVVASCLSAILFGNVMYYVVGWRYGPPALQHPLFRWAIKESDLQRMTVLYRQRGTWIVFISRFVPASRLPVFMSAGILRFSFWRMFAALFVSNLLFTPLFIWTASIFGQEMLKTVEHYERAALLVVVVTVLLLLAALHIVQPLCTWRGRRLWRSSWRQTMHWQYWPPWQIQLLLFPALWRLARRQGNWLVFTCANPGLPLGGFVGTPKSFYLRALTGSRAGLPRWTLLAAALADSPANAESRAAELDAWMAQAGVAWPVILKRDVGGLGRGVRICRKHEEARRYFQQNIGAVVAQEWVAGAEFSIWFAREPGASAVRVLAVSSVQFPSVTGDGVRTLERLILSDDRALSSARIFLNKFAARLADIPPAGEVIVLSEIAQPCDGAFALDATANLATPELAAAVDELSRQVGEFYFGRFTVRCPTREDLRAGKNLCVLGAAGVKAAGWPIRDPRRSQAEAHQQTLRQWEVCFAIGVAQRARGAASPSWRAFLRDCAQAKVAE